MISYIPKGGMCASCKNILSKCTDLDFKSMQQIDIIKLNNDDYIIVKCTNFTSKNVL